MPLTFHHKSSIDLYTAKSSYPLNGFTSSSCILNASFSLEYFPATHKSAVTNMTRCFQSQWRIHSKNNIHIRIIFHRRRSFSSMTSTDDCLRPMQKKMESSPFFAYIQYCKSFWDFSVGSDIKHITLTLIFYRKV